MEPTWVQHGPNLSQLGTNLVPCWVQIGSSRPFYSNHEGISRPLGIHNPRCQKRHKNRRILFQKVTEIGAFKAPEKQKNVRKRRSGNKSRKNDHEAKTHQFGSHLGAILASSRGTWEAFRGHFGRLGANWSQHKAILSHLGANLRPP